MLWRLGVVRPWWDNHWNVSHITSPRQLSGQSTCVAFDPWGDHVSNIPLEPRGQREPLWPAAVITFGLSLTATWIVLIGYALIRLIERAI